MPLNIGIRYEWKIQIGMTFHDPAIIYADGSRCALSLPVFGSVEQAEKFRDSYIFSDVNKLDPPKDQWVLCQQIMQPLAARFDITNHRTFADLLGQVEGSLDIKGIIQKWNTARSSEKIIGDFAGFTSEGLVFVQADWNGTEQRVIPWHFLKFCY